MNDAGIFPGRRLPALALLLTFLTLGGCAGLAPVPSPVKAEATRHNLKGLKEAARGDYGAAQEQFAEALRMNSSIENREGMIVALVNLARTDRLRGDVSGARRRVEEGLLLLPDGSDLAAELYFEKAQILLAAGELAVAAEWAGRAVTAERGREVGRRNNLLGRVLLRLGKGEEAARLAEAALKQNREEGAREEEANSLRLGAESNLALGRPGKAGELYGQALALDKELGLSGKIAQDLGGLGRAAEGANDAAGAAGYYRRAFAVSLNGGDVAGAATYLELLATLHRQKGETAEAEKLQKQREELLKAAGK
jgi:tetratricopeptide (TPR) repeat protein